jgi:hypothetical protein
MADLQFSRSDVADLADKLVNANLESKHKALLLAIFQAAAGHVSALSPPDPAVPAPAVPAELHQQLIKSFLPDAGANVKPDPGDKFEIHPWTITIR